MRLSVANKALLWCAISGAAAAAMTVFAQVVVPQGMQADRFKYPLRDAKTGLKTAEIVGDSWSGSPDGSVLIKGLHLSLYSSDERTNAMVEAAECRCRLDTQTAESDSDVRIEANNLIVTGRGFKWSATDRIMRIRSRVRVEVGSPADLGRYVAQPASKDQNQ
ncbi:MAG: hypothetical protein WCL44_07805 [bacterium]